MSNGRFISKPGYIVLLILSLLIISAGVLMQFFNYTIDTGMVLGRRYSTSGTSYFTGSHFITVGYIMLIVILIFYLFEPRKKPDR
jgi:hypothetical protein